MAKTSIARQTREIVTEAGKEAHKHWQEMPDGMVPVGDSGWYTSPNLKDNSPVDPRDCEHWPSSPYCGGNPWSRTPVGLDFDYGVEKCGVWAQIEPILGFTRLPPVTIGWRTPGECREEKKPPPPVPAPEDTSRPVNPLHFPETIDPNATVFVVLVKKYTYAYSYRYGEQDTWGQDIPATFDLQITHQGAGDSYYPASYMMVESYQRYGSANTYKLVPAIGKAYCITNRATQTQTYHYDYSTFPPTPVIDRVGTSDSAISEAYIASDQLPPQPQFPSNKRYLARQLQGNYRITGMGGNIVFINSCVLYGTLNEIKKDWEGYVVDTASFSPPGVYGGMYNPGTSGTIYKEEWEIGYISIPDSRNFPPPPDQKKKKDCCMQCCNSGSQQANKQNQDLEEIKKMLRELKKRIGTDEYPVKMPASLNTDYNDSGQKSNPGTVTEENLTSVLGRFIRYFDGVMGEWGIGFKVADADPTKEGDQPKFIHAPNLAELSAEMYSHIFDMWIMQYQLLHLHQRHAIESMLGRKVGIQNYYLLEALVDWCGFKRKDITKKIPFLFDIDSEKFDDFLKNKEQEIQILDFDPDDENSESFPDQMLRLKRMAAIIEATHTKRFNPNEDISKSVMGILQTLSKNTDRVNKDEVKKEGSEPDFDQWLREAETAFVNKTGQGDPNSPYGVPYAQRPRLTKLQEEPEQPTE